MVTRRGRVLQVGQQLVERRLLRRGHVESDGHSHKFGVAGGGTEIGCQSHPGMD